MKEPLDYRSKDADDFEANAPTSFFLSYLTECIALLVGLSGAFIACHDRIPYEFVVGTAMSFASVGIIALLVISQLSRVAQWIFGPANKLAEASVRLGWRLLTAALIVIGACQIPSCH